MRKLTTGTGRRGLSLLRLAGRSIRLARADEEAVAAEARRYLSESMGGLKGLPQKIGQLLAMSEAPRAEAFDGLTEASAALDFGVVERVLAQEWRRPWREVLSELSPEARAASLGQVHKGRLPDGRPVAVKVQYPGIARAIETDLRLLGWLAAPLGAFRRQFNLEGYREELLRDLEEELDYTVEAANQHQYHFLSQVQPNLIVPRVHGDLTTPRVLVTAWEDGAGLRHVADTWSEGQRKAAGRALLEHAFGYFRHGFVHADLHPGNFRFRTTTDGGVALVLYDFGCIFRGAPEHRLALLRLIRMTEANADDDPYPLFIKLGFDPAYLAPIADRLPGLCRVLFEPFIVAAPYHVHRWRLGERVAGVLGEDRWNFRIAGPPSLILLMRMFHGLMHALGTLDVELPWQFLLAPIHRQFSREMDALALPEPPQPGRGFGNVAKHLRIHVKRDGQTRVQLTSPMRMIDQLDETLDAELRGQIAEQGIDLREIVARVRGSGYRPQEVFRLSTPEKDVRVWLE